MPGSYSVQSIDDLAYVSALGIDVGKNNTYTVTFQFNVASSSGEGGSFELAPIITNSIDAPSLDSAISLMNAYVSKEINLSHCKIIVISEELAYNGISDLLYSLMNKTQIRPICNMIISKSSANDFIKNVKPNLETMIAKYYEILPSSSRYTGYTANVMLGDFFNQITCHTCDPSAMLGYINIDNVNTPNNFQTENTSESSSSSSQGSESQGNKEGISGISEIMGLAVFNGDKLVGELSSEETLYHLLICNEIENCYLAVPSYQINDKPIDLYLYNKKAPKINVEFINGTPFISLDINLYAKILSMDNYSSDMSDDKIRQYTNSANQYIKKNIEEYLYRTTTEFHSDIDGFGRYALSHFATTQDFKNYNWLDNYKNAFFNVSVNTDIESAFLLSGK